jgi:membrane carboxypeptidase/penicillin-binding protein
LRLSTWKRSASISNGSTEPKALYESGLSVTTTLDPALQMIANRAIEKGLRTYDKRHGWRRPTRNVIAEKHTVDAYRDERWKSPIAVGDIVPAVVSALGKPAPAGAARLIVGPYHADMAANRSPGHGERRRRTLWA